MDWLRAHEFLAIWLEGIALVLIFVWDRLDSRNQHKEMLAQLRATEKPIEVSEKNAAAVGKAMDCVYQVAPLTSAREAESIALPQI
jgi:hypothetical protein